SLRLGFSARGGSLQDLLLVLLEPIRRDDGLRRVERKRARANFMMERVLHRVFGLGPDELRRERAAGGQWLVEGAAHLRPEVLRVPRVAAQLERDQVIFLIMRRRFVHIASGAELLILEVVGVAGRRSDDSQ